MINMEWRESQLKYSTGSDLLLGRIRVGSTFYSSSVPKGQENRYKAQTNLPGLKDSEKFFANEGEAKQECERLVRAWFSLVGNPLPSPTASINNPKG